MVKFTSSQYASMTSELNNIAAEAVNMLQKSERSYAIARQVLNEIKSFILNYSFKDPEEEIRFFKEIKPEFTKELIYHREVYEIEAAKPVGNTEMIVRHYQTAIERVRLYFDRNQEFYNYYQRDKSDLDEMYFLRNNDHSHIDNTVEIDQRFCTVHSQKLSKLQAFELVNNYLQRCIYQLENPTGGIPEQNGRKFKSLWTDSKVALIELAYALYAHGSVNFGKGDIKDIITDLEIIFNIEVGNFYRTFQNMRIRKKNSTPFLDGLKLSYERKIDEYN